MIKWGLCKEECGDFQLKAKGDLSGKDDYLVQIKETESKFLAKSLSHLLPLTGRADKARPFPSPSMFGKGPQVLKMET